MAASPHMGFLTSCSLKPTWFWYLTLNMTTIMELGRDTSISIITVLPVPSPFDTLCVCAIEHHRTGGVDVQSSMTNAKDPKTQRNVPGKPDVLTSEQSSQVLRPYHCYCWSPSALLECLLHCCFI